MPEFLRLLPPDEALVRLLEQLPPEPARLSSEEVDTTAALGRVTAEPVCARHPLPAFARSTVDGYAVRAADTFGASDGLPAYLAVIGEVPMGAPAGLALAVGQAALIHTGGMLPAEADAVVMVEHTQSSRPEEVEVLRPAAVGENVLKVGEDVSRDEEVLASGVRLASAEIGGLMALGLTRLLVVRRPLTGIISSGDEVVPPDAEPMPGQVRDINTYTLSALVEQAGGQAVSFGIVPDRAEVLYATAEQALEASDMLIITAGSSASVRDLTAEIINRLGQPGVLVHGVSVRPGKPTILAVCRGKPVIGLPGNPVSALVVAGLFVRPVIERLLGMRAGPIRPQVDARLSINLASQAGREDWIPIRLVSGVGGLTAEPLFGKSNLIFTLVRADGLVRIPPDATGLSAGQMVKVFLFP